MSPRRPPTMHSVAAVPDEAVKLPLSSRTAPPRARTINTLLRSQGGGGRDCPPALNRSHEPRACRQPSQCRMACGNRRCSQGIDRRKSRHDSAGKPLLPSYIEQTGSQAAAAASRSRVATVLTALARDYAASPPAWFSSVAQHANAVIEAAPKRFADAFNRWRDLLAAAERQIEDATAALKDYSITSQERRAAEARQSAGNTQVNLLLRGSESQGSTSTSIATLPPKASCPATTFRVYP